MAKVINQIKYNDVEYAIAHSAYATCGTASATAAKVAAVVTDSITGDDFTLIKGVTVNVWFQNTNTADNATIAVGGSAAKPIYYKNAAIPKNFLQANRTYTLTYDGTNWVVVGDITAVTANSSPNLSWGANTTIGTVDGVELKVTMPPNPNTNTHYTTGLFVGASGAKSNAATSNGYTYLKLYDDNTSRASFKISGSGATTVSSDANGNITISSTDTNTNTDTKVKVTTATTTKAYVLGASSYTSGSATENVIADTGVYLDTTAGRLTAASFYATSDKRLKENIVAYTSEKSILDLPVYKYNYISDEEKVEQLGCLAQDLREICPEIVQEDKDNGYLTINESKIVYLLLDELKKVKAEMTRLNTEVEELKNKSN